MRIGTKSALLAAVLLVCMGSWLVYMATRPRFKETVVNIPLTTWQTPPYPPQFPPASTGAGTGDGPMGQPPLTEDIVARFEQAGIAYPPRRLAILAFKREMRLELWAWHQQRWSHVHDFPILGASGLLGPKLTEGDKQVPEGIYRITALNPNSKFHLSMKINYPNAFDLKHAYREGRFHPGGNIFIHGDMRSEGCLAMGNEVIEQLFALVSDTGLDNIKVIIAPYDIRGMRINWERRPKPRWLPELYNNLHKALRDFPRRVSRTIKPRHGIKG